MTDAGYWRLVANALAEIGCAKHHAAVAGEPRDRARLYLSAIRAQRATRRARIAVLGR